MVAMAVMMQQPLAAVPIIMAAAALVWAVEAKARLAIPIMWCTHLLDR